MGSITKEEARTQALYAAGKVALASRMPLNANVFNMTSRATHLDECLDDYDRLILELSEPHLES